MKRTARILVVVMMIAVLASSLVSCSKILSGSWNNDTLGSTTYTFEGKNYTKTYKVSILGADVTKTEEGTYEIKEDSENSDQLVIAFTTTGDDGTTTTVSYSFVEGEENDVKYIKIDGVKYTKVDK